MDSCRTREGYTLNINISCRLLGNTKSSTDQADSSDNHLCALCGLWMQHLHRPCPSWDAFTAIEARQRIEVRLCSHRRVLQLFIHNHDPSRQRPCCNIFIYRVATLTYKFKHAGSDCSCLRPRMRLLTPTPRICAHTFRLAPTEPNPSVTGNDDS